VAVVVVQHALGGLVVQHALDGGGSTCSWCVQWPWWASGGFFYLFLKNIIKILFFVFLCFFACGMDGGSTCFWWLWWFNMPLVCSMAMVASGGFFF